MTKWSGALPAFAFSFALMNFTSVSVASRPCSTTSSRYFFAGSNPSGYTTEYG